MSFMQLQVTQKGALYCADCAKCGATIYVHEWATWDNNDGREQLKKGNRACDQCTGTNDPDTFRDMGNQWYAARYSAPGYMDCTDWSFGKNKRALIREVKEMYGE